MLSHVWTLQLYGLEHTRLPCPSLSPKVYLNSCPLSPGYHPTISFSGPCPFSSCTQSFPASGSFTMSPLFALGGKSIGASTSESVLPVNIQSWFPLGLTNQKPQICRWHHPYGRRWRGTKEPLDERVGLKLNIQKTKIMAPGPITSWQIDGETVETVADFIFLGSKITADGDCSHEIKRHLLGRKIMTNLAY